MNDAFTQYDLDMNEAIINNDVQKAQNALAKLEMILGFQQNFYDAKNQINQNQLSNNQNLNSDYYGRYMDMVNQINSEKEREEAIRQFEAQLAYQKEKDAQNLAYQQQRDKVADAQWEKEYALSKKTVNYNTGGGSTPKVVGDDIQVTGKESKTNEKPENYYFKNGYQPRYIQDSKGNYIELNDTNEKVKDHFMSSADVAKQTVWEAGGRYYVWNGKAKDYVDVTKQYKSGTKYYTLSW
jgi:hypothetical protein